MMSVTLMVIAAAAILFEMLIITGFWNFRKKQGNTRRKKS
jgi:hypothetical protein